MRCFFIRKSWSIWYGGTTIGWAVALVAGAVMIWAENFDGKTTSISENLSQ
jgi:hypothetical protein